MNPNMMIGSFVDDMAEELRGQLERQRIAKEREEQEIASLAAMILARKYGLVPVEQSSDEQTTTIPDDGRDVVEKPGPTTRERPSATKYVVGFVAAYAFILWVRKPGVGSQVGNPT